MKTKITLDKNGLAVILQGMVEATLDIPDDEIKGWRIETAPLFNKNSQLIINQYGEEEEPRIILQ